MTAHKVESSLSDPFTADVKWHGGLNGDPTSHVWWPMPCHRSACSGVARIPAAGACPNSSCTTEVRPDEAASINRPAWRARPRNFLPSLRSNQTFPLLSRWQEKAVSHERACTLILSYSSQSSLMDSSDHCNRVCRTLVSDDPC